MLGHVVGLLKGCPFTSFRTYLSPGDSESLSAPVAPVSRTAASERKFQRHPTVPPGRLIGDSEMGNIIIRTYAHLRIYSQYFTVPQMCINGQQGRIGLGTAIPDARLHVTAGVSTAFGMKEFLLG